MTEKRFYKTDSSIEKYKIYDDDLEDAYFISCDEHTIDTLTDLLNEQNQRIKELEKTNKDYDNAINEISNILMEAYEHGISNPYLKKIGKVKVENR